MTTWVLVANAAEAKLYNSPNLRINDLHLIAEYAHPDSRKKVLDLISDKAGRYSSDHGARSSYEKTDPKELEAEHFAKELIKALKTNCNFDEITSLIIVAPNNLYKFITKHFAVSQNHQEKVTHLPKDYTKYSLQDLNATLKKQLFEIE